MGQMMGSDPKNGRGVDGLSLRRLAWLPIPVLLPAMIVLWALDLHDTHESAFSWSS